MSFDATEFRDSVQVWTLQGQNFDAESHNIASQGEVRIGRESDNDIVLLRGAVSRYHASMQWLDDKLILTDNGSVNGSFVNGQRVEKAQLQEGDSLRFDAVEFRVFGVDADGSDAPTPPPLTMREAAAQEIAQDSDGTLMRPVTPQEVLLRGRDEPIAAMLYRLEKQRYIVGRSPYNDIVIKTASVSSFHARLERQDGVWFVYDEDSSNGSFINGEPVTSGQLNSGDVISFGKVRLDFDPGEKTLLAYSTSQVSNPKKSPNYWLYGAGVLVIVAIVAGLLVL